MARTRPTVVLVMGILNIVLGGLGLLTSLCGGGLIVLMRYGNIPGPNNEPLYKGFWEVMDKEVPDYFKLAMITIGGGMLLLGLLIVAGIGLVTMRRWGRTLSVFFCIVFALMQTASVVWSVAKVNPAAQEAQAAMMKSMPPQAQSMSFNDPGFGAAFAIFIYAIELIYCIALLVVLFLPSVRAAFAGTGISPAEAEDYHDARGGEND
jgi:hypothetical protein